ncbi:hypothetical protein ACHAWF_006972 [Thalassiosira exigua]
MLLHAGEIAQTLAISAVLLADPTQLGDQPKTEQLNVITSRLDACNPKGNCVSSNYREPPNRYVSPFKIVNDPEVSFQRAVRDLTRSAQDGNEVTITEIASRDKYIHLTMPGTAPSSLDDIELTFSESIVNVKCEARVTLPPPPFCLRKNCINGNMDQMLRVERIGRLLGLPTSDADEMRQESKWTPIFFNSDRVPGWSDDDI